MQIAAGATTINTVDWSPVVTDFVAFAVLVVEIVLVGIMVGRVRRCAVAVLRADDLPEWLAPR